MRIVRNPNCIITSTSPNPLIVRIENMNYYHHVTLISASKTTSPARVELAALQCQMQRTDDRKATISD
jgi:hypothetical protein